MKTIKTLGKETFSRLAHKLNVELVYGGGGGLGLICSAKLDKGDDLYVWDWEYGIIKFQNPSIRIGAVLANNLSALRTKLDVNLIRFTHIAVHIKKSNKLEAWHYENTVDEVMEWKKRNLDDFS